MASPANILWQAIERFTEKATMGEDLADTTELVIEAFEGWRTSRPTDWSEAYEEMGTALDAIQKLGRRVTPYPPSAEAVRARLALKAVQTFHEKLAVSLE